MRSSSGQRSQNRTIYALLKPTKKHDIATWLYFFRSRVILCCVSIKYRTSYFQTRFQICQFSPKRVLKIFLIDSWIATIRENVQKRQKRFKFTNRNPEKLCQPVKELRARYCTHNARARRSKVHTFKNSSLFIRFIRNLSWFNHTKYFFLIHLSAISNSRILTQVQKMFGALKLLVTVLWFLYC